MRFTKGIFLYKADFKTGEFILGFIIWSMSAYIFYAFFQLSRETFRYLSGHLGEMDLLILTPTENFLNNLFLASNASALGYSIALRFTLQSSKFKNDRRIKSKIRRTLNTEGFWTWSYLLWFGKLGSLLGVFYLMFPMQYDVDLIKEFPILLILLPMVLFCATWPDLSRIIRTKRAYFLGITILFFIMSVGYAFQNFSNL